MVISYMYWKHVLQSSVQIEVNNLSSIFGGLCAICKQNIAIIIRNLVSENSGWEN